MINNIISNIIDFLKYCNILYWIFLIKLYDGKKRLIYTCEKNVIV